MRSDASAVVVGSNAREIERERERERDVPRPFVARNVFLSLFFRFVLPLSLSVFLLIQRGRFYLYRHRPWLRRTSSFRDSPRAAPFRSRAIGPNRNEATINTGSPKGPDRTKRSDRRRTRRATTANILFPSSRRAPGLLAFPRDIERYRERRKGARIDARGGELETAR